MKQKIAFAMIMGFISTALISFTLIGINVGFNSHFLAAWLRSWAISYVLAVTAVLLLAQRIQLFVNAVFSSSK